MFFVAVLRRRPFSSRTGFFITDCFAAFVFCMTVAFVFCMVMAFVCCVIVLPDLRFGLRVVAAGIFLQTGERLSTAPDALDLPARVATPVPLTPRSPRVS